MPSFPARDELERMRDASLTQFWEGLIKVRDRVLGEIEPLRKDKQIGSSLQAKVVLSGGAADMELLRSRIADLPMLFIVSDVELRDGVGELQITPKRRRRQVSGTGAYVPARLFRRDQLRSLPERAGGSGQVRAT